MPLLRQNDGKDRVTSRARLVHSSGRYRSRFVALVHERHHLAVRFDHQTREVLDIGAKRGMLSDSQDRFVLWVE
jgi:hypothetical protein